MKLLWLKHTYFKTPVFLRMVAAILITMTLFGAMIHYIEPKVFPTIFEGVWWAFVTAATVGYGDYVPLTAIGKLFGILLILTGSSLLAFYVSSVSAATISHENNLAQGAVPYRGRDHMIIIGWNARTKRLIHLAKHNKEAAEFVVIDHSARRLPIDLYPIHYIKGDPSSDETLRLAGIQNATAVIVTADLELDPWEADNHTVLSTIAIRGNHPSVRIVAELLSDRQVGNALRAGASAIIRSDDCVSALLYHELFHQHAAKPFENMLHILNTQQFSHELLPKELENKTFAEVLAAVKGKDRLLLGIIRDENYHINPKSSFSLKQGDILLSLVPWE